MTYISNHELNILIPQRSFMYSEAEVSEDPNSRPYRPDHSVISLRIELVTYTSNCKSNMLIPQRSFMCGEAEVSEDSNSRPYRLGYGSSPLYTPLGSWCLEIGQLDGRIYTTIRDLAGCLLKRTVILCDGKPVSHMLRDEDAVGRMIRNRGDMGRISHHRGTAGRLSAR